MSRTVFELPLSNGQIIVCHWDGGVPVVNAFVLGNLCEYRHKLYTVKY